MTWPISWITLSYILYRTVLLFEHSDVVVLAALGVLFHSGGTGPSKVPVISVIILSYSSLLTLSYCSLVLLYNHYNIAENRGYKWYMLTPAQIKSSCATCQQWIDLLFSFFYSSLLYMYGRFCFNVLFLLIFQVRGSVLFLLGILCLLLFDNDSPSLSHRILICE